MNKRTIAVERPAPDSSGRPQLVTSALVAALTHKLRTPLAVISNDLSYLKAVAPELQSERALQKVSEITEILSSLNLDRQSVGIRKPLNLTGVIRELVAESKEGIEFAGALLDLSILGERESLVQAFSSILAQCVASGSLQRAAPAVKNSPLPIWVRTLREEPRHEEQHGVITISSWRYQRGSQMPKASYSSFTEAGLELGGEESLSAPITDAKLWMYGAETQVSIYDGGFSVRISFPLVEEDA